MTKDDIKERLLEEDTLNDNPKKQQQDDQRAFHVVLVDVKKAANNKIVHCVEKPLAGTHDLKFVAISYRWGELEETMVDTGVGYMANITSFDLNHFFCLCKMITREADLQYMDYVWVDAICVNQNNHEQRKAAIYQMTHIYERANYILAVPDLHLRHLYESNHTNGKILDELFDNSQYLYYLIQGNMQKLMALDQQWLDEIHAPNDRRLRHVLTKYSKHFAVGFTTYRNHDLFYFHDQAALNHIYETNAVSRSQRPSLSTTKTNQHGHSEKMMGDDDDLDVLDIDKLHTCDDENVCPFKLLDCPIDPHDVELQTFVGVDYQDWKYSIPRRSRNVRQAMVFFIDRILDWSTRAWVISEFHIAKNKNNKLKYWFLVLGHFYMDKPFPTDDDNSFFTFDFDFVVNDKLASSSSSSGGDNDTIANGIYCNPDGIYQIFHAFMRKQLNQQTFLEKILKSKASKHEDRFYAILPSSEYKSILSNKDIVDHWSNITTLTSVKLELYKWMTTKHKLELLFLSGSFAGIYRPKCQVLPTFATSTIMWPHIKVSHALKEMDDSTFPGNFDLTNPSTIQLVTLNNSGGNPLHHHHYKLTIRPREYYRKIKKSTDDDDDEDRNNEEEEYANYGATLQRLLGINLNPDQHELIFIPTLANQSLETNLEWDSTLEDIFLVGYSTRNQWILTDLDCNVSHPIRNFKGQKWEHCVDRGWEICHCDENSPGFDIY